jgi:HlyD family secretion protein
MSISSDPAPNTRPASNAPPMAPPRRSRLGPALFFLGLIALGSGILYTLYRPKAAPAVVSASVRTARVQRGSIEWRLRVDGVTAARDFANITAPRIRGVGGGRDLYVLKMAKSGSFVKKGDVVAEIDPQSLKDRIDDTEDGLRDKQNSVEKKKVSQELDNENLTQTLRVAKAQVDKAHLDMKAKEVRTAVDQELLDLAVEEAEAQYKQIAEELPLRARSQEADLKMTMIDLQLQQESLERYQGDLDKFTIKAPMDGMVVVNTLFRPGGDQVQISEGDQLSPGQPFMKIVDVSTMQVEATINQAESSLFRIGQTAVAHLDAFPGAHYPAKVFSIGALATTGGREQYYLRTLPIRLQLLNVDSRIIPDLSASADVLVDHAQNVLIAPASALTQEGDKYFLYVRTPQGFQKREVKIGIENGTQVSVLEGVTEGDVVRLN